MIIVTEKTQIVWLLSHCEKLAKNAESGFIISVDRNRRQTNKKQYEKEYHYGIGTRPGCSSALSGCRL